MIDIINFPSLGDERGSLVALEANSSIPFTIKRVYYIFDTKKGVARGFHAHKSLQQIFSGKVKIFSKDILFYIIVLFLPKHIFILLLNSFRSFKLKIKNN